jgi:hypothetical protein
MAASVVRRQRLLHAKLVSAHQAAARDLANAPAGACRYSNISNLLRLIGHLLTKQKAGKGAPTNLGSASKCPWQPSTAGSPWDHIGRFMPNADRGRYRSESEVVNKFGVPEQVAKTRPIQAQSADIARAMASICNDERARFGGRAGMADLFTASQITCTSCWINRSATVLLPMVVL